MENKLIVVLGMHRSGTSAITRALSVMGVDLGNRMAPPAEAENDKGFWEDVDVNALNVEMLEAINSDWHHVCPLGARDVDSLRKKGYLIRAAELLRQKAGGVSVFGFKDPRVAKLAPFWKEVFDCGGFEVGYVVAIRHPLSVVKSLERRNAFDPEKSYLLWAGHVISSLMASENERRVLVDYDCLMLAPEMEIRRIAETFDLGIDQEELRHYSADFLDQKLRRTAFELNELLVDVACPPLVREMYVELLDVSKGRKKFDDPELLKKARQWAHEFDRIKSPLVLLDKYFSRIAASSYDKKDATEQIQHLDVVVVNLNQQIKEVSIWGKTLQSTLAERDALIMELNQRIEEISIWGKTLPITLAERDVQAVMQNEKIAALEKELLDRHAELMKMSDWAYGMMLERERRGYSLAARGKLLAKRSVSFIRRQLARTVLGDVIRHLRDHRRCREKRVSIEALRQSLTDNHGRLVIVFPVITWDFRWQRPQHIVSRLRDHGYSVLYLAMSLTAQGRRLRGDKDAIAEAHFNELDRHINQIWLSTSKQLNIYTDPLEGDDLHNLSAGLGALISELRPKSIKYLVQFPGWWPAVKECKERLGGRVIFDCMDDHGGFSTNTKQALETEEALVNSADLVITSSDLLEQRAKQVNPNTIQIKNGTEFEHFANPRRNGELDHLCDRPVIGYYGAISDWFDMEIVAYCARKHPDWHFVLIGATFGADLQPVDGLKNVHLLGEKPYKDLPGYFAYFDVCTIPFKIIPLTLATNPVKFYEYLSAGKPVVAVELPELVAYRDDCYLAGNADEFLALLERAYGERDDEKKIERRIKLASENSWDSRVRDILESSKF